MDKKARGVAPVIASLMLVVITVAAFGLTWGYVNTWIRVQRAGPLIGLKERLVVEDVWFRGSQNCSIYVRNVSPSGVEIKIVTLTVNATSIPLASWTTSDGAGQYLTLTSTQHGFINATLANPWASGSAYVIKLGTERGSSVEVVSTA